MIKLTHSFLPLGLLLSLAWPADHALAEIPSYCQFQDRTHTPLRFESDIQTRYVPLDASIGTEFGQTSRLYAQSSDRRQLACYNNGTVIMRFRMLPVHPPLPLARTDGPGEVLQTNIPGIGARIQLFGPFSGEGDPDFRSEDGHTWVPFTAIRDTAHTLLDFELFTLFHRITLVKTGELAPGVHQVDSDMFKGHLDFGGIGDAYTFRLRAEVIQAQCTIGTDPVTPNPVPLGDFNRSDFTHVGYTTPKVDFRITLAACQTDPDNNTYATLELNSQDTPITPGMRSVFSLTEDSEAAGVGIQVFKDDGSPMPLNLEVPMTPLNNGNTVLNLKAAFHQTAPSHAVRAGLAKGQLNFIVRYR